VIIGGTLGDSSARIIVYKVRNMGVHKDIVRYGNLDICFTGPDGKSVEVTGGTYNFLITKKASPVDLNGDGISNNDFYLQVEVMH
jgi:hypothetical protein